MTKSETNKLTALTGRLTSWAQNEEMIDQHYTEHGRDCTQAAEALRELLAALEELQDYAASALQELDASATGWYYQLQRAAQKASAAIAKAKGDA